MSTPVYLTLRGGCSNATINAPSHVTLNIKVDTHTWHGYYNNQTSNYSDNYSGSTTPRKKAVKKPKIPPKISRTPYRPGLAQPTAGTSAGSNTVVEVTGNVFRLKTPPEVEASPNAAMGCQQAGGPLFQ